MKNICFALIAACIPFGAWAQTPAQAAGQEMVRVYEEFCLVRFPDPQRFEQGAAAHHMVPANDAQSAQALLGRPGRAWQLITPKGSYLIAIESGFRQGCAVAGDVSDDAGIHASFNLLITEYATAHEFGPLDHQPVRHGSAHGEPAEIELIGATPGGMPRQAFVNMAAGSGDVRHVRLTREFAPPLDK
jgi:hypothetical protein